MQDVVSETEDKETIRKVNVSIELGEAMLLDEEEMQKIDEAANEDVESSTPVKEVDSLDSS